MRISVRVEKWEKKKATQHSEKTYTELFTRKQGMEGANQGSWLDVIQDKHGAWIVFPDFWFS